MKAIILYILFLFFVVGCKTDIKQTAQTKEKNITKVDTIKTQKHAKQNFLKEKLIGAIYSRLSEMPYFKDYSTGGVSIGEIYNSKEYSLAGIRGKHDKIKYILFEEVHEKKQDGDVVFKCLDFIDIDNDIDSNIFNLKKETVLFYDVLQNGKKAPELFALAPFEPKGIITKFYKVWRANRKTGKIEEIKDLSNITAINEDF